MTQKIASSILFPLRSRNLSMNRLGLTSLSLGALLLCTSACSLMTDFGKFTEGSASGGSASTGGAGGASSGGNGSGGADGSGGIDGSGGSTEIVYPEPIFSDCVVTPVAGDEVTEVLEVAGLQLAGSDLLAHEPDQRFILAPAGDEIAFAATTVRSDAGSGVLLQGIQSGTNDSLGSRFLVSLPEIREIISSRFDDTLNILYLFYRTENAILRQRFVVSQKEIIEAPMPDPVATPCPVGASIRSVAMDKLTPDTAFAVVCEGADQSYSVYLHPTYSEPAIASLSEEVGEIKSYVRDGENHLLVGDFGTMVFGGELSDLESPQQLMIRPGGFSRGVFAVPGEDDEGALFFGLHAASQATTETLSFEVGLFDAADFDSMDDSPLEQMVPAYTLEKDLSMLPNHISAAPEHDYVIITGRDESQSAVASMSLFERDGDLGIEFTEVYSNDVGNKVSRTAGVMMSSAVARALVGWTEEPSSATEEPMIRVSHVICKVAD